MSILVVYNPVELLVMIAYPFKAPNVIQFPTSKMDRTVMEI